MLVWHSHDAPPLHTRAYDYSRCPRWSVVCRRAGCRTRSPHFQQCPTSPSWRSSLTEQADACSPSGICCSSGEGAEQRQDASVRWYKQMDMLKSVVKSKCFQQPGVKTLVEMNPLITAIWVKKSNKKLHWFITTALKVVFLLWTVDVF